jgi:regulator of CtrA degradation
MAGPLNAFIEDSYQETLTLMTELRDYLTEIQSSPTPSLDPQIRTRIIGEISSMTRHMTEAMAWLLLQKAAAAGEITSVEASERADGLMTVEETPREPEAGAAALPMEVRGYIDRSRRLYGQIRKLRETTDRATG